LVTFKFGFCFGGAFSASLQSLYISLKAFCMPCNVHLLLLILLPFWKVNLLANCILLDGALQFALNGYGVMQNHICRCWRVLQRAVFKANKLLQSEKTDPEQIWLLGEWRWFRSAGKMFLV
jgi:hypothetical protein